jgi:hypothetical protein
MHHASPFVLRCTFLAILIGGFVGVDFAVPRFFPGHGPDMLGAVLLGCCIGQINLIAVWAALASGNFVVRLPWSALLITTMWYALVLGNRTWGRSRSFFSLDDAMLVGVFLLAGIVVAQIPLWIARQGFHWQLISRDAPPSPSGRGRLQFNLQHMFLGTTLLSIALAPIRTILPRDAQHADHLGREMLLLFAAAAICNFLVTMPCIWGAMRPVSKPIYLGIVGWLLYCGTLTAVEYGSLVALLGAPYGAQAGLGLFFYLINVSQCATVFGTLLLLRALGFQLVRTSPASHRNSPAGLSAVFPPTAAESTAVSQATQESP